VKACTYLFNHKALAKVFRAKILSAIKAAGLELPGLSNKGFRSRLRAI